MESASLGVILDSSTAIEAERKKLDAADFLVDLVQRIGEREAALSSISVAELAHGYLSGKHAGDPFSPSGFP